MRRRSTARCIGCASALIALAACAGASRAASAGNDWTRFGWNAVRSSAPTFSTGIAAGQIASLKRQQVQLDGTADSSPIYLHGVEVGGTTHDVFFVTTTYGKTEAIDAASGNVLWRFTPPGYSSWAGSPQITTATPVADPGRQWIYAASPGGRIYKLSVANGHSAWSVSITKLPSREKIAASLNFADGHVIATTGGYIGDAPPYQGHVAIIEPRRRAAPRMELALLEPPRSDRPVDLRRERLRHLGPRRCRRRSVDRRPARRHRQRILGRQGELGRCGAATIAHATALVGNYTPANTAELNSSDADLGSTSPVVLAPGYIAQGGKDGKIRVLSVTRMRGTAGHLDGEVQVVPTPSGTDLFTAPAVWHRRT